MMDNGLTRIFDLIHRERTYQDRKWCSLKESPHYIEEWINIIDMEVGEAYIAIEKTESDSYVRSLEEIIQIAAVACACLEQYEDILGNYKGR